MQEVQVWSMGQEDPLEKEMATHFCFFAQKTPQAEEPGRLQAKELQRVGQDLSDWALTGARTQTRYDSNNLFLILSP